MKKKLWLLAVTALIVGIIAMSLSLTGCDNGTSPSSHNHNWGEWTVTTAATCSEAGAKERVCKDDATHKETDVIPIDPNAHDYRYVEGSGTAPTCIADGEGDEVCSHNSEHTKSGVVIDKLEHEFETYDSNHDADCEHDGTETAECVRYAACGETDTRTETDSALGHDYQWSTTATFLAAGEETEVCSHNPSHTGNTRPAAQLPVKTAADWTAAVAQVTAAATGDYTLTVSDEEADEYGGIGVAGSTANTFGATASGSLSVTLKGTGKLYLTSPGSLLRIVANQTLVIDSIDLTLEGMTNGQNGAAQDNNTSAVYAATNGTLELKNGTISGNTAGSGGVYVSGASFTMSGGVISGNTTTSGNGGGGVYMYNGGTFTMNGGEISGNTAANAGGGVYKMTGTTARIVTGTIYGNDEANESVRNTANSLAALAGSGTAQYGTFSGPDGAWVSNGTIGNTNNTIKVVNGVMQP